MVWQEITVSQVYGIKYFFLFLFLKQLIFSRFEQAFALYGKRQHIYVLVLGMKEYVFSLICRYIMYLYIKKKKKKKKK